MPTYSYGCRTCGHQFDQFQKFSDDPLTTCPECGGEVRRLIHNVGVVFKGSGWYVTDSRKASSTDSSSSEKGEKSKASDDKSKPAKSENAPKETVSAGAAND